MYMQKTILCMHCHIGGENVCIYVYTYIHTYIRTYVCTCTYVGITYQVLLIGMCISPVYMYLCICASCICYSDRNLHIVSVSVHLVFIIVIGMCISPMYMYLCICVSVQLVFVIVIGICILSVYLCSLYLLLS